MRMIARAVFAALMLGLLPQTGALAADYGGGSRYGYPPPPVEIGSGWYLRGDIGGRFALAPSMVETATPATLGSTSGGFGVSVSAGYGYQFSDIFRGELAVDYGFPLNLSGTLACDGGGDTCVHTIAASTASVMANFYMDLAVVSGFTPYVGAGVGLSMVSTTASAVNTTDSTSYTYAGATQYNLAWALMAGVAWDMSPNTVLDLGVRLASLGGGSTGPIDPNTGPDPGPISIGSIIVPEVRLGMRYKIN